MGVGTRWFRFGPNKCGRWRPLAVVRCSNGDPRWRRWVRLAGDHINIPVHLRTGVLYEDLLNDVVSQLKRISHALKAVPSEE